MSKIKAKKFDQKKPKLSLVPPKAIIGIARAMTHGADKYNRYNYKLDKGLDWDRPYSALLRHIMAWWDGEEIDKDSGLNHLDCAGACMVMLMDLVYSGIGKDTRFRKRNI